MKRILKIFLVLFLICMFILVIYLKAIPIGLRDKSKHLLTDFFNLQFKREVINTSNFVNNPKLAELYNLKFNRLVENNKNKSNIKLTVNINSIIRKKINSYIVKFEVIRTFNYKGLSTKSYAKDYYACEIQNINNELYINKLIDDIDYNVYLDLKVSNLVRRELIRYFLPFDEYSNYLNKELKNRKDFECRRKTKKLIFKT
ncbi:hypothetical protein [Clostridium perfringens]|uniref:hypothetical protein n=2 Tax=Clostridium perfringens TaxID=1502 RepID=UPI00189A2B08|nr:hypothetical protein [Clostridium perfringens]MDK0764056.1 hypothetical protein [Clostridium perfringens]MDM0534821.1 hypothetical protein [Clostridium perfringens]